MLTLDLTDESYRWREQFNRLISNGFPAVSTTAATPAVNIWTGDEALHVTAELPGIDVNQLDISVHGNELTLKGRLAERQLQKGERWIRREHTPRSFTRTLRLPFRVDSEKVNATYTHGVLALTLPRAASDKPQRIVIKAA